MSLGIRSNLCVCQILTSSTNDQDNHPITTSPKAYQFETCKFQYVQTEQFDVTLNRVYAFDARRINRYLPGPHCTQNSSSMYEYYMPVEVL